MKEENGVERIIDNLKDEMRELGKTKEKWKKKPRDNDKEIKKRGFPGGAVVESLPASAGDMGSSPGPGGSHMPRSD